MNGTERTGRDGRLLALVIVVSLAVLLVLARFRFAASDGALAPTPTGPLERIVARSTYEDMAATIGNLRAAPSPSVVVLLATPIPPDGKPGAGKKNGAEPRGTAGAAVAPLLPRLVPAFGSVRILWSATCPPAIR